MKLPSTVSAPAYPPLPSDPPFTPASTPAQASRQARQIAACCPYASFTPHPPTPQAAGIETEAMPVDFRAKHPVRHYLGDEDTGTLAGPLYPAEQQALAELRTGQGKYAELPIIRDILQRWQQAGPSPQVRVAYGNWKISGSLELLLDALVAEMQLDGSWFRLAGADIARDSIQERISAALTGAPYRRTWSMNRQACEALSDWSALAAMDDRAVEKNLRFIKVMAAAFQEAPAARAPRSRKGLFPRVFPGPQACA